MGKCGILALALLSLAGCGRAADGKAIPSDMATGTSGGRLSTPTRGITVVVGGAGVREAPVLGVVIDGRMRVLHVEAGGVQPGDLLIALGGAALTSPGVGKETIWRAAQAAPATTVSLPLMLVRDGQTLTVTAQLRPPKRWSGMPTPTAVPYDEYYF